MDKSTIEKRMVAHLVVRSAPYSVLCRRRIGKNLQYGPSPNFNKVRGEKSKKKKKENPRDRLCGWGQRRLRSTRLRKWWSTTDNPDNPDNHRPPTTNHREPQVYIHPSLRRAPYRTPYSVHTEYVHAWPASQCQGAKGKKPQNLVTSVW